MTSKLRLLLFAGPNGSGKSTFTTPKILTDFGISPRRYINADDIARELSEQMPNVTQTESEWAAFYEARHRRQTYREEKISFAFETVFSHPSTFVDIEACRQSGFEIIVIFVTTKNSAMNIERVARRFQSGGHHVDTDKIISRYGRSMSFLPKIVEESARAFVYDNSGMIPNKFTFRQGDLSVFKDFPPFLQQQLLKPLLERKSERRIIQESFPTAQLPALKTSEFKGNIIWAGTNYTIQSTTDRLIQHDLCLFSREQQQSIVQHYQDRISKSIKINYKDAAGSVSL
jgi:predicted ABC-type ATPase